MKHTNSARRYRDGRARRLVRYANSLVALASGFAVLTTSALWGTGWHAYSFHYALAGAVVSLASMSLGLLAMARRIEESRGFNGVQVAAPPPVQHWTGTVQHNKDQLVLPTLSRPVELAAPVPAPAPAPVARPVPVPVERPAVPAPMPAPNVAVPTPAPAVADADGLTLAGQA